MTDYFRAAAAKQFERLTDARKYETDGLKITPQVMSLYDEQVKLARGGYTVLQNSAHTAMVKSTQSNSVARDREVNLELCTCTCTHWQQRGFPCRHAIVFAQRKRDYNWAADSENWYRLKFWRVYCVSNVVASYNFAPVRIPLIENLVLDGTTLPPVKVAQRGAPRKRRFRSAGEGQGGRVGKAKKARRCALCGADDHNKRTCWRAG